jgi:hypothetical protein
VESLRIWLELLSPWIEIALGSEKRAVGAESEVRTLTEVVAALQGDVARLEQESADLTRGVARLTEELRGANLARRHDASQIRDSLLGFFGDEIALQLGAVREGLGLEPARITYALERLDDLEHAINGKVKWLRSLA